MRAFARSAADFTVSCVASSDKSELRITKHSKAELTDSRAEQASSAFAGGMASWVLDVWTGSAEVRSKTVRERNEMIERWSD